MHPSGHIRFSMADSSDQYGWQPAFAFERVALGYLPCISNIWHLTPPPPVFEPLVKTSEKTALNWVYPFHLSPTVLLVVVHRGYSAENHSQIPQSASYI